MKKIKKVFVFKIINSSTMQLRLIAILIAFIFIIEGKCYCLKDFAYAKASLRVPRASQDRINQFTEITEGNVEQTNSTQLAVKIYKDKNGVMRINMKSIPECVVKDFLKLMRDDQRLRGKILLAGGAVRNILLGLEPSDIDVVILNEFNEPTQQFTVLNNYLDSDREMPCFKGMEVQNIESIIFYKQGGKIIEFDMPDLSLNHMLLGFDDNDEDPFLLDPDAGYDDLVHRRARLVGNPDRSVYIWRYLSERLIEKMLKYNLTPTKDTGEIFNNKIKHFIRLTSVSPPNKRNRDIFSNNLRLFNEWVEACANPLHREAKRQKMMKEVDFQEATALKQTIESYRTAGNFI